MKLPSNLWDAKFYVNSRKWSGNTSVTLQNHVERCRAVYVDIETAAMHVPEQISNQSTWVQSLIDYINDSMDPKICAQVTAVTNEINGISDDFENQLLTFCQLVLLRRIMEQR